jgi:peptide/nickel transport system substrate-binding protein
MRYRRGTPLSTGSRNPARIGRGRWSGHLALGVGAVAVLFGAVVMSAGARETVKPVLRINGGLPTNLDAAIDVGFIGRPLMNAYLIHQKADGTFGPWLATSWRYLPAPKGSGQANKNFELTLRHDVRYSDGTAMTAATVRAYFEHWLAVKGLGQSFIAPIKSFTTDGKWKVVVHVKSPDPNLPLTLSDWAGNGPLGAPESAACIANKTVSTLVCGAGPYKLDPSQSVANDHLTLLPNPYYFDKSAIKWSKIIVRGISQPTTVLQALQAGQLDVADGDPSTAAAAAAAGFTVEQAPKGAAITYFFDLTGSHVKALADPRVRRALSYAIDRKAIAAAVAGKYGVATSVETSVDGANPKYGRNYYPYDPAKAKALLAAAGYPNGFTIDSLGVPGPFPNYVTAAEAVAKYFGDVGVTLKVHVYGTFGDYANAVLTNPDAMTSCCLSGGYPMSLLYTVGLQPGSIFNRGSGGYNDVTLFRLWQQGIRSSNPSKYWQQMTARITDQALLLTLYESHSLIYVSKKVGGVGRDGTGYGFSHPTEWFPK